MLFYFQIENTSSLSIQYSIKLDSLSLLRYSKSQGLPDFVKRDPSVKNLVGKLIVNPLKTNLLMSSIEF